MPQVVSSFLMTLAMALAGMQSASLPSTTTFHSVVYFEVVASNAARASAQAAMKTYLAGLRTQGGFVDFESYEQSGRPGHFAFMESWRDQDAFDSKPAALEKQFADTLQPIRISDIDRRPYKVHTVAPRGRTNNGTVYVITHVDATPTPQLPMMLQKLAEDSRRDDGNLRFDIYQHTMRANHYTIVEAWRNRQALDAHAAAAHTREYRNAFGPMAGSPLDERVFEAVAP